jgi:large subunit ribosomal protein L18
MARKIRRKKKMIGTADRPRLVVSRSLKNIYGQLVDDIAQKTIFGASELSKELREELNDVKSKVEKSKRVGAFIAKKAKEMGIETIIFDRNGYQYHGRVKALAEGAREGGLKF